MNSVFNINLKLRSLIRYVFQIKRGYYWPIRQILESMNPDKFESSVPKVPNKSIAVEVIGSGARGAPTSVFLHSGERSYLFNCGEGTQRICVEFRNKVNKIQNVFITYPSWKNCGGLLGASLTLQSTSAEEFLVYGSPKLKSLYYASKKFVKLKKIQLGVKECLPGEKFKDHKVSIKYVHLYENSSDVKKNLSESKITSNSTKSNSNEVEIEKKSENENCESDNNAADCVSPKPECQTRRKRKRSLSEAPKSCKLHTSDYALSFICTTSKIRGTLLVEKCVEMNIPKGPLLGKLKNGEDLTLEDGQVIKSEDVMTPDTPGVVIIFVECPTEAFLDSLLNEPEFYMHQSNVVHPEDIASIVVHFTPPSVVKNPKYEDWTNRFPKSTKHLYVNEENKSLGLSSLYRQQYKLNMLLPDLFPLLKVAPYPTTFSKKSDNHLVINEGHSIANVDEETSLAYSYNSIQSTPCFSNTYFLCNDNNRIKGESLVFLPLSNENCYDYRLSFIYDQKYFVQENLDSEGFAQGYDKFRSEIKELETQITMSKEREYPKIVFLGTGSSQPHKRRNSSGILVLLNEHKSLLLDCGEGTYCQILRFFGAEKTDNILMNLIGVYVSHIHVDHHLGLIDILLQRKRAFRNAEALKLSENDSDSSEAEEQKKIFLLIPSAIENWLQMCHQNFGNFMQFINFIYNSELVSESPCELVTDFLNASDLNSIKTTLVPHCYDSYGVMLEHKNGWKITYSGDTKPSENLIELGKNCDLLIHEATMEDGMIDQAQKKSHCTISQAITVGEKMNAKFTILTHFSQRYTHIPFYKNELNDNVAVAFDNMIVSLYQLPYLAKLKNFLQELYAEEHLKLKEKTKIYEILKKRENSNLLDHVSEEPSKKQKVLSQ